MTAKSKQTNAIIITYNNNLYYLLKKTVALIAGMTNKYIKKIKTL